MARRSSKARRRPKAKPQGILELNAQGFGFVKTAEGEFFIPASKVNGAFPGDLVEVSRLSGQSPDRHYADAARKPSARIARVIMRARDTLIGRYEVAEPFGVVVPEGPSVPCDIFTLRSDAPQVNDGDLVEVRIVEFPTRNSAATGTVVRVLGSESDSDIAIDLIIAEHQFETEFSPAALEEAERCSLDAVLATVQGYRDLRDEFIFTIDPVDARDFDDAVSLERKGSNVVLGVHIADVSRFVPFNSSLDMDARRRATSVYLVDRVLPMLPERLSNGLCSLVPEEDRCSITVKAEIAPSGSVSSYEVFPSVIRSKARLSYEQAQAILSAANRALPLAETKVALTGCETPHGSLPLSDEAISLLSDRIPQLDKLAKSLFARRKKDGCMDFDRVEAKARLDGEGRPQEIVYRRRTAATELIEEAMILANSLVAQWLTERGLPCVYRVHDAPDGDALHALYEVLQESPLFSDVNKRLFCSGEPHTLQDVLARVKGMPQQELVNALLLRAMKRAVYRTELSEHYGLALQTYCHFTSPIRRYPDLLVHRMLKEAFFGHSATYEAQRNSLSWMAEHSSHMEREAEKAARQSQLTKIIEYLEQFIGQSFTGIVSSVSSFGLMVRLECTATGSLSVEDLGEEYFSYDAERQMLVGTSTGMRYRLGQTVDVVLVSAKPRERRMRFKLASDFA